MFSLKTILFAATAALAGVASAAPLVDARDGGSAGGSAGVSAGVRGGGRGGGRAHANVDAVLRSLPESGSSLVARCDTCNSVPGILTPAIVKLDGILAQASKWSFLAPGDFPTHLCDRN